MSMGGGGGGQNTVTRTELDPAVRPYVEYGLSEAQKLYQTPGPSFYPGQTYVSPSQTTQLGLQAAQNRALSGNPLVPAAQAQTLANIQGGYLGGSPFFQGAFQPAAQAAQQSFYDAMGNISSTASRAGRYGSPAMQNLENRALGQFSTALTNTAGQLAYQNYEAERARQMAATGAAPQMAQADYQDIQQLLNVGQAQEGYQEMSLQDAINRFNYQQNLPAAKLQQYLSAAYGSPQGGISTQPVYRNTGANILGGAIGGYALSGGNPYATAGGAALGGILG
jgi:hypothetical protein